MNEHRINGWSIYQHPLFALQIRRMIAEVEKAKAADPDTYLTKPCAKILAATRKMAFEVIPADPTDGRFRQGDTLGSDRKHWFRGKYFQQYRLFFRYHAEQKIIVLAWVNDETTKRAYGSKTDAYTVFKAMLDKGHPPDSWEALLAEARKQV